MGAAIRLIDDDNAPIFGQAENTGQPRLLARYNIYIFGTILARQISITPRDDYRQD